jgi:hypothetical protein
VHHESGISNKDVILFGIVLIVAGAGLWIYTVFKIQALEQTMKHANLSLEDRWRSEGSLQWWRDTSRTTLYPVALLLIIIGLAAMVLVALVR